MELKIKIGDEVCFDESGQYFVVTDIADQNVKTFKKGSLFFQRLYFGDKHKPEFSWRVKYVRAKGS